MRYLVAAAMLAVTLTGCVGQLEGWAAEKADSMCDARQGVDYIKLYSNVYQVRCMDGSTHRLNRY